MHSRIRIRVKWKVHPWEMLVTLQRQLQYNDHDSHKFFNLLQIVHAHCIEVGWRSGGGWLLKGRRRMRGCSVIFVFGLRFWTWNDNLHDLQLFTSSWTKSWYDPTSKIFDEVTSAHNGVACFKDEDLMCSFFLIKHTYLSCLVYKYTQTWKRHVLRWGWAMCSNYRNHSKFNG